MSNELAIDSEKIITDVFERSEFVFNDPIPMDGEIAEFIYELNKNKNIITTNSCAGHDKFESNANYDFVSHPYLAFLVSKQGWDIFWGKILPSVSLNCLIHVMVINEEGKCSIIIRCHYDDKKQFWENVKPVFLKHFPITY